MTTNTAEATVETPAEGNSEATQTGTEVALGGEAANQDTEALAGNEGEAAPEEAAANDNAEGAGEEGKEEAAPQETAEQKHKRAGGYQRKIERLEREKQILLEQLHRSAPPQPQTQTTPKAKTPEEQAAEYIGALVQRQLAEAEAKRQEAARQADFQRRMSEARAARPDFDDVLMSASDVPVSQALGQALLTAERPGEIMYTLAKSPAELARISALPPLEAAREIGKLEAKLASGAAPQTPKPANRPPAPPSKVGGSASSTRSLEDLPISEYKRAIRSGRR